MASRLNEDDSGNQNKWADIDDDDEDWAPNDITWGDGTKTTLASAEAEAQQAYDAEVAAERERMQGKAHQAGYPPEPPQRSSGLASGRGLILKNGSQDRPALVAKPPAPVQQAKSPWASLPPVDKVSPSYIDSQYSRDAHRDGPYGRPVPKEIAADDFSRSAWRNSNGQGGRELYNSQSGRYEPVSDRRGPPRPDQHGKPAMLHRQDGPAEPSNAFQTHRASHEIPIGRRRGSSNVSGGSGTYMQRGPDAPFADSQSRRRPSFVGSSDGHSVHGMNGPNQHNRSQLPSGWMPRSSPNATYATPHHNDHPVEMGSSPPTQQPVVDEVEYQKKLMQERRDLARKRRQEEEEREENARRERIQKKLEALGPAPEKKAERKEEDGESVSKSPHIQKREAALSEHDRRERRQSTADSDDKSRTPAARRPSHSHESRNTESWAGQGSRSEKYASWTGAGAPASRNVWGSPNNDKGLGNGTFNPDLGRLPGTVAQAQTNSKPTSAAPAQTTAPARASQPGPIGSRASRYDNSAPDLANKWVSAVAENDQKINAMQMAELAAQKRRSVEAGRPVEDVQPVIKETWRPVQVSVDGTRRNVAEAPAAATDRDAAGKSGTSMLRQASGPSGQPRASRFFPSKEPRMDQNSAAADAYRPSSPSPPPPTMEDHPVYAGSVTRPNVSLPKPQPVVKLPPAASAPGAAQAHVQPNNLYRPQRHAEHSSAREIDARQEDWQRRINDLLNNPKLSPPKTSAGIDVSSRHAFDHPAQHTSATVSLPSPIAPRAVPTAVAAPAVRATSRVRIPKSAISKPMAEECFEEQEMGSLPRIRLPHKAPEAAWHPAVPQIKPLPRKLLVQASVMDPYPTAGDLGGHVIRIQLPGTTDVRTISVPGVSGRGSRGSTRGSPRSRASVASRGGSKRESTSILSGSPPSRSSRGSRGSYRSRASDSWSRRSASRGHPASPTA